MTDHVLERRVWVRAPRPEVFEFFADPRNLERVNPPRTTLRWLRPPPCRLSAGAVLDFDVRLSAIPVRWRVLVREFDPPYRFIDVQLRGPFARWEHRHRFVAGPAEAGGAGDIGTWVEDRVTYRMPLGPLGAAAHALGAGRRITAMFEYREQRIRELLHRRRGEDGTRS
jgi:ligand-binding SRPBCC domain-containing protein